MPLFVSSFIIYSGNRHTQQKRKKDVVRVSWTCTSLDVDREVLVSVFMSEYSLLRYLMIAFVCYYANFDVRTHHVMQGQGRVPAGFNAYSHYIWSAVCMHGVCCRCLSVYSQDKYTCALLHINE